MRELHRLSHDTVGLTADTLEGKILGAGATRVCSRKFSCPVIVNETGSGYS